MARSVDHKRWLRGTGWVIVVAISLARAAADDPTARFYEELRQRSLFSLVESDCLRRLETKSLNDRERSDLVLELSRSFAAHAWQTVGAEQDELWRRSRAVVSEWLSKTELPPRRELLDAQLALIDMSESEWHLAQSQLRPDDREFTRRGSETVGLAIERLTRLEKSLGLQVRLGAADSAAGSRVDPKPAGAALTPFERRTLWQQVRWRLGLARTVHAKFSEPGSADRAESLVSANEWLLPLAGGPNDDRLTGDAQLALAEVARLRSDFEHAAKVLATFEKTLSVETPEGQRERFVIERSQLLLAMTQPTEAAAFLLGQRRESQRDKPAALRNQVPAIPPIKWSSELAYWQVAVELAMWQLAADRGQLKLADEVWERATAEVSLLEKTEAGYWSARASADWQIARETHDYGHDLAALVRQARQAFAAGEADTAIRLFDEAIAKASRSAAGSDGAAKLVFDLRDSRATLLFQAKRYADSAAAFRELAESPQQVRSPVVHLLWAFSLGRLFEQSPSDAKQGEFVSTLLSLRERYADQPEASEAAWLLGQLAERDQKFCEAINRFALIAESHPRRDAAWAAIARCHERQISQLRTDKVPITESIAAARQQLTPVVQRVLKRLDDPATVTVDRSPATDLAETTGELGRQPVMAVMNPFDAELLVRSARLLIEHPSVADQEFVDQLLARVIGSARDRTWLNTAKQLQVVLLASRRKIDDAERLLDSLDRTTPDELLSLLDGLSSVAAQTDGSTQRLVAELQLRASRRLANSPQSLTESQRTRLWRARAEAFAVTGQPSHAVAAYQKLLDKSPRDTLLLHAVAELCERIDSPESLQKAKGCWRKLEAIHNPGNLDWLDARWHVIRCCQRLNERAEADKLLKLTKLLYPDLGNAAIKARFGELDH